MVSCWEKPAATDCFIGEKVQQAVKSASDREYYNYFRTYDPSTGRYVTSDPIGLEGGLNTYGYVGGNPLLYFDLLGLVRGKHGSQQEQHRKRRDKHVNRNRHNKCPKKEPANGCDKDGDKWNGDTYSSKNYHGSYPAYRGTGAKTGSQCVYDGNGDFFVDCFSKNY